MRDICRNPWLFAMAAIFWGTFSSSSNKNANRWQHPGEQRNIGEVGQAVGGFHSTNIIFSDCKVTTRAKAGISLFADTEMTGIKALTGDANKNMCVDHINKWREAVSKDLPKYTAGASITSTDLDEFLKKTKKCSDLVSGNFSHIGSTVAGKSARTDNSIFVISAALKAAVSCEGAIRQWGTAFADFKQEKPTVYTDNTGIYENNDVVAFVSLLSDTAQEITCGTATGCEASNLLICYIKPSGITANELPVSLSTWRAVEELYSLKPTFTKHTGNTCLASINKVRQVEGLGLPPFTANSTALYKTSRKGKTINPALDKITCAAIENLSIDQMSADGHTILYGVKDSYESAPSPDEAVSHWESGFDSLKDTLPPAFSSDNSFYKDCAVTGYVSMMADAPRSMQCFDAIGCSKSALICTLTSATLEENKKPISDKTWGKIELLKGIKPTLTSLSGNCLTEINAVRTKEEIGLAAFTASSSSYANGYQEEAEETLLNKLTCKDLDSSAITVSNKTETLMYFVSENKSTGTCAEAVEAWQKGISKFEGKIPPAYSAETQLYTDAKATNFVALMSEAATSVNCYEATGCNSKALICKLSPPALKSGVSPISEKLWKKLVGAIDPNGSSAAFPAFLTLITAGGLTSLVAFGAAGIQL